jgi:hypothetical protein
VLLQQNEADYDSILALEKMLGYDHHYLPHTKIANHMNQKRMVPGNDFGGHYMPGNEMLPKVRVSISRLTKV